MRKTWKKRRTPVSFRVSQVPAGIPGRATCSSADGLAGISGRAGTSGMLLHRRLSETAGQLRRVSPATRERIVGSHAGVVLEVLPVFVGSGENGGNAQTGEGSTLGVGGATASTGGRSDGGGGAQEIRAPCSHRRLASQREAWAAPDCWGPDGKSEASAKTMRSKSTSGVFHHGCGLEETLRSSSLRTTRLLGAP